MKENFKIILNAFREANIELTTVEFKLTRYSLNTELSFKFENIDEFSELLKISGASNNEERTEEVKKLLVEEGIDHNDVFYLNFYPPKVAEL